MLDGLPIILQIVVLNGLLIILSRSRANDPNARTEKKCLHLLHSCVLHLALPFPCKEKEKETEKQGETERERKRKREGKRALRHASSFSWLYGLQYELLHPETTN